jgi:hypothetical protein
MSKLRERIAANREARERTMVEVADWGDSDGPMKIYSGPVTGMEIDKVVKKHPGFLANPSIEAMVDMIILKSEDENGEKHFTLEDKMVMLHEPFGIVAEVFASVFSVTSVEEQEKN